MNIVKNTVNDYYNSFLALVLFLAFVEFFELYIEPKILRPASEKAIREEDLSENFNGRVIDTYNEENNHNVRCAKLGNNYIYRITPSWEREIEVGDSISKKKNSFKVKLYKRNGVIKILNYEDTYKKY